MTSTLEVADDQTPSDTLIAPVGQAIGWPDAVLAAALDTGWVSFDRHGYDQAYTRTHAARDFGDVRWFSTDGACLRHPGYLQMRLPASRENAGFKAVGAIAPRPVRTCVARLRFAHGFDFGYLNDIKLPCGLGGGSLPMGGVADHGDGFTVRFVLLGANRNLGVSAYNAEQPGDGGDVFDTGIQAQRGRWYTLKLQVTTNSPGCRDGWLGVTIDGRRRISRSMRWSERSNDVDTVLMTCFRDGGGTPSRKDGFVDVDYLQWH